MDEEPSGIIVPAISTSSFATRTYPARRFHRQGLCTSLTVWTQLRHLSGKKRNKEPEGRSEGLLIVGVVAARRMSLTHRTLQFMHGQGSLVFASGGETQHGDKVIGGETVRSLEGGRRE